MTHQTATIDDTVYFWFAANDTSGSGGDGATPLFDVREAGAVQGAVPLLSGTPTLLTNANYPAGCHEIAVAATTGNGFAADDTFAVFCTLAIDTQNPSGFVGSCTLTPLAKEAKQDIIDTNVDALLTRIVGTLAAGTHNPATAAQIAVLSDWINGGRLDLILDIIAVDTTTDIPALIATAQADLDILTGSDGATLATTQGNYAPSKAGDAMILTAAATSAQLVDDILDEVNTAASHGTANSLGEQIRQLKQGLINVESTVNDASAATSSFVTSLTNAVTNFYKDQVLVFTDGILAGSSRIITSYTGATKTVSFAEAFTSAPVNGTKFIIEAGHSHNIEDIADAVTVDMDGNSSKLAAIIADTQELQADWTDGGRLDLLLDRLITELDTARGEPAQGAPAASTKIGDKIDYLYKAWRNKSTQTATTYSLFDDAGSTVDHKSTVSDDSTTATRGEIVTGP